VAKLVRHLILDQAIPGSSPGSSAKKRRSQTAVSFFLSSFGQEKNIERLRPCRAQKKRDRTFVLSLLHKKPVYRKLILQVLLVLQVLLLLVLQVLLVLLELQELQLQVLLQELQFF
jgi:hypothetical protein